MSHLLPDSRGPVTEDTVHFNKHSLMVGWNEEEWAREELGVGSRFGVVEIKVWGRGRKSNCVLYIVLIFLYIQY